MVALVVALLLNADPIKMALSPAARTVVARPDRVTAYAIEPSPFIRKPSLGFRDALAARRLSPVEGKAAVGAVYAALRDVKAGLTMSCFDPHHGIKVERGRRWVKFWVCYECRQTEIEESGGRRVTVASGLAGRAALDRLVPKVRKGSLRPKIVP